MFDQEAEPDLPLPDHVPDDLVARYGTRARRTVRGSRTWRYPFSKRYRRARSMLKNGDLWLLTLLVFAWSVVAAGAIGALVYATVMFPWAFTFVVVPVIVLFGLSLGTAVRVTKRRDAEAEAQV